MNQTSIEWTDFSENLIRYRDADGKTVWACAKVSDGCKNCYSEAIAHRYRKGGPFTLQQVRKVTPYFDDAGAAKLLRSKKLAGKRVFIGDMTDVFGEWVPFELLDKLFAVFALRPDVTFQVLTKRPERMAEYFDETKQEGGIGRDAYVEGEAQNMYHQRTGEDPSMWLAAHFPLPNVWLGTSVENQEQADKRIPHLLKCPAAVRFLSVEPMLGAVVLRGGVAKNEHEFGYRDYLKGIHWVIVGGESGGGARPCEVDWIRSIIGQCASAGVACFVKQLGRRPVRGEGDEPFERIQARGKHDSGHHETRPYDSKGGDPSEWPEDLRVREMPDHAGKVVS